MVENEKEIIVVNNLATAIRQRGMTQTQFADRLGVDVSTVSRMCKLKSFTFSRIAQICEALGTNEIESFIRVIEVK